ncbi:hypothetical protein HWC07_gp044 [Pantoea phage vB_PagM_LIET2]|uniref:Uncharacterized protein n=1 Tax=Pantoea phage vB_PagM_LIET2 TaxID=2508071 RepID=A0A411AW31_9CAUD|nr:hypothetical protein HWC07_gp044 [Pantoea phage vB_PagM_LIET2]QAX92296.1 hypothetical protein LIET2_gp044 [Pantoea phage vB_PagM_LIET2]UJH95943.1 hypothetical protein [Pantoea phage Nafs113]
MTDQELHDQVMRQMAVLIYNQPAVQQALTNVSKVTRTRGDMTEAGVRFVQAVADVALTFAQDPTAMAQAIDASPKTIEQAVPKPGVYPATAICDGDIILNGGSPWLVTKVLAGRDEVQITLENGAVIAVLPDTQINLVQSHESNLSE